MGCVLGVNCVWNWVMGIYPDVLNVYMTGLSLAFEDWDYGLVQG